jgi:invasion protein IalB
MVIEQDMPSHGVRSSALNLACSLMVISCTDDSARSTLCGTSFWDHYLTITSQRVQPYCADDRSKLDRKFKAWLLKCHTELDKRICFLDMAGSSTQVSHVENHISTGN